jgi:AraC-like DNA-binding protein/ligand-binding sensor protein
MAQRNATCAACLQFQETIEHEGTRETKTLECFAGLSETAVPVRAGENLVGYLQTGQVFLRAPTRKRFKEAMAIVQCDATKHELADLEVAYFRTRVLAKREYMSCVMLVTVFAQHLGAVSNEIMVAAVNAELPSIKRARAFILAHHGEKLQLRDAARSVHMTSFYFCKLFRKETGLTFTHFLARIRIDAVKRMLLNPHTRITEAAYGAGFQSLSQFNRVFHRVVGETPTVFREHLQPALPLLTSPAA